MSTPGRWKACVCFEPCIESFGRSGCITLARMDSVKRAEMRARVESVSSSGTTSPSGTTTSRTTDETDVPGGNHGSAGGNGENVEKRPDMRETAASDTGSGETTPTGALTPSTTVDSEIPDYGDNDIHDDERSNPDGKDWSGDDRNEADIHLRQVMKWASITNSELSKLSISARTQFISHLLKEESLRRQPYVGRTTHPELVINTARIEVPYATKHLLGKPGIAAAISGFSMPATLASAFLFVTPSNYNDMAFEMSLQSWHASKAKDLSIEWIELPKAEPAAWQHGQWTLGTKARANEHSSIEESIVFPTSFIGIPTVAVFLSGLYLGRKSNLRFQIWAESVTETGFILKGGTWDDSTFYNCKITWVAYANNLSGVHSGRVNTNTYRTFENPQHINMGYESFPIGKFKKPPKVMIGLNFLDFGNGDNELAIQSFVSNVNNLGMCWNADSSGGTVNYGVGLSYLAIEQNDE
ncbi:hypothetical protein BJ508DRAFT_363115 [Ascobolus immersus RN42]|uniref:H-type lectin domain-containing protein n=1 Tax=Ascobolus immersus RN42 TaxID=1160509 RepID=A0A3N4I220_ASCIM|nr:hypothetical protein BJ508DRAFT_363115 [Ascobolus immersus RN42]